MKTHRISFAALTCAAALIMAQPVFSQGFGLRGGVQQTEIVTDLEANTFGTETGLALGAFVNIPLPARLAIQAEGLYTQKIVTQQNLSVIQNGGELNPNASLELGYIEMPILLAYRFKTAGIVHPRLYGGPVIGVIVNEKVDLEGKQPGDIASEAALLTKEAFKDRELGWLAGAGVSIGVSRVHLLFDVRYSAGIGSVQDDFAGNPLSRQINLGSFTGLVGIGF